MRFKALEIALSRQPIEASRKFDSIQDMYAINVFNDDAMQSHLDKDTYKSLKKSVHDGTKISRSAATQIATGMKSWAMAKGVTHYTHWFQPLTGTTAEKHDSFFEPQDGRAVDKFSGDSLVQQEPDASSLPSGGLRNTFEARGYTAWDPSSPAFIYENTSGKTLCIPTVFVSYTGEALDYKAPLLKSIALLDKAATDVCKYFYSDVTKVGASLGVEQEYFLVDKALYNQRPDLIMCGRTLFGYAAAKNQQMDDHYFGSIPDRVFNYMVDFENEALKLGIPVRTRHNEVAPGQYECAPQYEEINLAVDHNQLLMDLMDEVANHHGFKVLFHEKPFAGINGSGKHNNWSLLTNTGVNLLSPGNNPLSNLSFVTFFINTIKAFHDNADLLRASIASASNDHRLGANEAPPAIMSIFIGSTLTKMLEDIENNVKATKGSPEDKTISIAQIPEILLDNTDRNRTSPFAFTGNKFELRAVGSSKSCASPMMVLNASMSHQLIQFKKDVDQRIAGQKEKKNDAILAVLRQYLKDSKRVLFEGNGYGDEWVVEAKKRGLSNLRDTPAALDAFISDQTVSMMNGLGIFKPQELKARHHIELEDYMKKVQIEGRIIDEMTYTHILPAALQYQKMVADNVNSLKASGIGKKQVDASMSVLEEVSEHINALKTKVDRMVEERKKANKLDSIEQQAKAYSAKVNSEFDDIRYHADKLERLVDDSLWSIPKYRELLHIK
ncbi:MAG: glutamine synthetase III [Bacteroidetes bacterium]|jgi:glutamine synthetase|nr:glutamine synthetase III [Bacteroidota bacterium]